TVPPGAGSVAPVVVGPGAGVVCPGASPVADGSGVVGSPVRWQPAMSPVRATTTMATALVARFTGHPLRRYLCSRRSPGLSSLSRFFIVIYVHRRPLGRTA